MERKTNILNGKEALVTSCRDELDQQGVIKSGFGKPYPFRVIDSDGRTIRKFTAREAKVLRRDGCVGHILLAQ